MQTWTDCLARVSWLRDVAREQAPTADRDHWAAYMESVRVTHMMLHRAEAA